MFVHRLRVLYADTDTAGIVYHGNYLRFLEAARSELLRDGGIPYSEVERRGFLWPVVEVHLRHRKPARYDDLLEVVVGVSALGAAQVTFQADVYRAATEELLCESRIRLGCVDRDARPTRIPADLRELLARYPWRDRGSRTAVASGEMGG